MTLSRFSRYLRRDDRAKERFLAAIAGGATESAALEKVNRAIVGQTVTVATVRAWLREDPEFAQALRVARTQPPGLPDVVDLNNLGDSYAVRPSGTKRWTA